MKTPSKNLLKQYTLALRRSEVKEMLGSVNFYDGSERLFTVAAVARAKGISQRTVRRDADAYVSPAILKDAKAVRRADAVRFYARREVEDRVLAMRWRDLRIAHVIGDHAKVSEAFCVDTETALKMIELGGRV